MIKFRQKINPELKQYIDNNIISKYKSFDEAHKENHAKEVIENALLLSNYYDISADMVYTAAAYHDIGLIGPRETHNILSGEIVRKDKNLKKWFSDEDINLISQAVEDHRSSNGKEPRGILGKIISEADRVIDCKRTLERTLNFGISNYPELSKEEQIKKAMDYIEQKYGPSGRIKIWIPESKNKKNLLEIQKLIKNKKEFYNRLSDIYKKNE